MSITHIPYEDNFDWIEIRKKRILHLLRNVGQPAGAPVYDITPYLVPAFYNRDKVRVTMTCGCIFYATIHGLTLSALKSQSRVMFAEIKVLNKDVTRSEIAVGIYEIQSLDETRPIWSLCL